MYLAGTMKGNRMIFLDPKSDIAFKKLFGDIRHKDILISFLNGVLERTEGEKIIDVSFTDPHNIPETLDSKKSIVDVRCTDQLNNHYIVEMQVINHDDYIARTQYYSAVALARQLASGHRYQQLVPVIFIGILDFKIFKSDSCVSHHYILNDKTHEHALKHLSFHFIELIKFNKKLEELSTILDKWIYFLRYADGLQKVPASLKDPVITEAFDVLEQGNWSNSELTAYDSYLDALRTTVSHIETAERRTKFEIAQALLDILDIHTIAKKTGLSISEIETLKKNKQE